MTVTILDLPPLPDGVTHTEGHDEQQNRDNAWLAHCPACMYRYGWRNGVTAVHGKWVYADGSHLTINDAGEIEVTS